MDNIIKLARTFYIAVIAVLAIVIGAGMVAYGSLASPPSRESLQVVEGTISEASRVTRKSRRSGSSTSYYEMTMKPKGGGAELKLRVPSIEMAESDVRSIINRPVKAEFDSEQDVYALSTASAEVLTYKNSIERRHLGFRQYYVDGLAAMVGGAALLLVGLFLGYRRHRKEKAAAAPQAPQP
ncbi:MAG: hypothetical protein MUC44_11535 [Beijerinckiaceae bacterium]|jgi:hypothetical protein|nr:hypothetical protein [Beijerinckiaceae bacterium]